MDSKLRVAIIGCGNIGSTHATAYLAHADRATIVACCDLIPERAQAFAQRFGIPAVYTDMEEMMRAEQPQAVSVCTWNRSHASAAICALRGGADVICEKPMAMSAAEAEQMQAAAQENGRLLMVGFVRRFGNDAAYVKPVIESGEMGEIYYAKAQYLRAKGCPGGWFGDLSYAGGGPLIDLGVHVIDLVRYLAGNPRAVRAYGITCRVLSGERRQCAPGSWQSSTPGDFVYDCEDSASALITFENGMKLLIETSYSLDIHEDVNRIELYGTKKSAVFDPSLTWCSYGADGKADIQPAQGDTALSFDGLFEREIGHFISCVTEGTPCRATAEDGIELMRILDAVYASAQSGQAVQIR